MAEIIDGRALAAEIRTKIKEEVSGLKRKPGLVTILVGENPASQTYVGMKQKACEEVGFYSRRVDLPMEVSQEELLGEIEKLNRDEKVDGILVQLPLPEQIDKEKVVAAIDPGKDVDCFHPANVGKMALLEAGASLEGVLLPCTPWGVMRMIESTGVEVAGKKAVVVGRSNLVGKPAALLLLAKGATVTICHSKTADLAAETKTAEILVVAVGRPEMVTGEMIREGAVVIDVGTTKTEKGLTGDVEFASAEKRAGWLSPVPGGAGPMTIACLLENTLLLAKRRGKKVI